MSVFGDPLTGAPSLFDDPNIPQTRFGRPWPEPPIRAPPQSLIDASRAIHQNLLESVPTQPEPPTPVDPPIFPLTPQSVRTVGSWCLAELPADGQWMEVATGTENVTGLTDFDDADEEAAPERRQWITENVETFPPVPPNLAGSNIFEQQEVQGASEETPPTGVQEDSEESSSQVPAEAVPLLENTEVTLPTTSLPELSEGVGPSHADNDSEKMIEILDICPGTGETVGNKGNGQMILWSLITHLSFLTRVSNQRI